MSINIDQFVPRIAPPLRVPEGPLFPDDLESLPTGSVIDGARATHSLTDSVDFIIVGSGAAGATAAVVLSEAGYKVAMVEEGPWVRTREFGNSVFPAMKQMFRGQGTAITTGKAFLGVMQGRCVGGSTTVNSAIAWRPPEDVVENWQRNFGLGDAISMKVLEPHFAAIEHELNVHAVDDEAMGDHNALFGLGAQRIGIESHRIRRYDAGCKGSAGCLTGCRTGRKLGMNISYVPRALHAGAKIYTDARVLRVETRNGRATGIKATLKGAKSFGEQTLTLHARRGVFVAASAVQTPNVLRRSGLKAHSIGRHFQAHPGVSIAAVLDRPVHMDFGASQGYNSLQFLKEHGIKLESLSLPPELAIARLPGVGTELASRLGQYPNIVTWAVVIKAHSQGRVTQLFGDDRVDYAPSREDMTRARKGMRALAEMLFAVGAKELFPGAHGMPFSIRSTDEIKVFDEAPSDPRAYTMIISHMFGSARMGTDVRTSTVGTDFQTHEVSNLYVIDSSVFPTNLGVNPQHTIMGMARLAAARVAGNPPAAL